MSNKKNPVGTRFINPDAQKHGLLPYRLTIQNLVDISVSLLKISFDV